MGVVVLVRVVAWTGSVHDRKTGKGKRKGEKAASW